MSQAASHSEPDSDQADSFQPQLPKAGQRVLWSRLYGDSLPLTLAGAAQQYSGLLLVITPDSQSAEQLQRQLRFFCDDTSLDILCFPDWETLPYDTFSPHQDIISERLETLCHLPTLKHGVLLVPVATLLQRLPPKNFLDQYSLALNT
ncbi:Transcription-repair coupling factor, partial [hydrothermal vent metagenome]